MKLAFALLYFLSHIPALSQTFLTPSDILVKKNHVKKITSKFADSLRTDHSSLLIRRIWNFDSTGKLIREQGIGSGVITHYYSDEGLLRTSIIIGQQIDTVTYTYDQNKRLLNQSYRKYDRSRLTLSWEHNCQFNYPNKNMTILENEIISHYGSRLDSELYSDTLLYNDAKLPVIEIRTNQKTKTYSYYNRKKELTHKTETTKTPNFYKKTEFIYRKGRLIREEEYYINGKFVQSKTLFEYIYDERGLIKHIIITRNIYGEKDDSSNSNKRTFHIYDYEYY